MRLLPGVVQPLQLFQMKLFLLYRAAPTRGSLVRLDRKILDHDPVRAEAGGVIEDLVGCIPWKVVRNRDFSQSSHINLQEKREASSELRAVLS